MLDIDALEKTLDGIPGLHVTKGWVMSVIGEIRRNRAKIAQLEAEIASLKQSAPVSKENSDFPSREFDDAMSGMDKAFGAFEGLFSKFGKKR